MLPIRLVSVHMNLLEINANRMSVVFNPPPEVDWKRIETLARRGCTPLRMDKWCLSDFVMDHLKDC